MWKTILKTADLNDVRQLLSPGFFRVFPTSQIMAAVRELVANYRDGESFEQTVNWRLEALDSTDLPIRLDPDVPTDGTTEPDDGRDLLTLYFHQLLDSNPTLLDLRRQWFDSEDESLRWSPSPLYIVWDDEFIDGIRSMYRGFYTDNDEQFEAGLDQLNLSGMGDVFLAHFGGGEQGEVEFDIDDFHDTFQTVLSQCVEHNRSLHRQFVALGIYLATLYDHLDHLGGTYDVRAAFEAAERMAS